MVQPEIRTAPKSVAPPMVLESGDDFEIKAIPNIRKLIANAMFQSLQNSAQLTHHMSADARKMMKLRKKFKQEFERRSFEGPRFYRGVDKTIF